MAGGKLDDSLRLATTIIGIDKGTIVSGKPRSQASGICSKLLLCKNFNDALT